MKNLNSRKANNVFIISIIYMLFVFQLANQLNAQDKNQLPPDSIAVYSPEEQEKSSVLFSSQSAVFEGIEFSHPMNTLSNPEDNVPHINMLRTLAAKIPGVEISVTNGDAGSIVMLTIRGKGFPFYRLKPLFVIDGIPQHNNYDAGNLTTFSRATSTNDIFKDIPVDWGNSTLDINIDEIEQITIVKGTVANILYGSLANNGAILIDTKKGFRNKKGFEAEFNSSTVFDKIYEFPDFQYKYGSGYNGAHIFENSIGTWGPELDAGNTAAQWDSPVDSEGNAIPTPLVSYPKNLGNFFRTGLSLSNNISLSGNSEKAGINLFMGDTRSKGVIPNTNLRRNNISSTLRYTPLKTLTFSGNITFNKVTSDIQPTSVKFYNPVRLAYFIPPNVNILDLKDYWINEEEGQKLTFNVREENPWFVVNENLNDFDRQRTIGNINADLQLLPGLNFSGLFSKSKFADNRRTKLSNYALNAKNNGQYGEYNRETDETFRKVLLSFKKNHKWFYFNGTLGGNLLNLNDTISQKHKTQITEEKDFSFVYDEKNLHSWLFQNTELKRKNVYFLSEVGIGSILNLGFSYGIEGNKNLEEEYDNNRSGYFTLNPVISSLFSKPEWIDIIQGNISWGNTKREFIDGYSPYALRFNNDLLPEYDKLFETGFNLQLFKNRLDVSINYYSDNKENLILPVSVNPATGFSSTLINAGTVKDEGYEALIKIIPVVNEELDMGLTFSFSKSSIHIDEFTEGIDRYGLWSNGRAAAIIKAGEGYGEIIAPDYIKVDDPASEYYGWPLLDDYGFPVRNNEDQIKLGNIYPEFSLGMQNNIAWKNLSLNSAFDWQRGGTISSLTMRYLMNAGKLNNSISGSEIDEWNGGLTWVGGRDREHGGLSWPENYPESDGRVDDASFIPGVYVDDTGSYDENLGYPATTLYLPPAYANGGIPWDFAEKWTYSASFIKLREFAFSYSFPKHILSNIFIKESSVSVIGSNLLLWSKTPKGIDPEQAYFYQNGMLMRGTENFSMPPIASWGFKFNVRI